MTRLTIAVDVDLTIVDTLGPWLQHFESVTGVKYPTHEGREKYHLGPIMQALAMDAGVPYDPDEYWRQSNLYDNMKPDFFAQDAVQTLNDFDDVIFVSACFPEHEASKRAFCREFFGDIPFISTHHKEYIDFDVIIDDCDEVLHKCDLRRGDTLLIQPLDIVKRYFVKDDTLKYSPMYWGGIIETVYRWEQLRYNTRRRAVSISRSMTC